MRKDTQADHAIIAFFKENVFQILTLVFALLGLWSYAQNQPIVHSVSLNKVGIEANAKELEKKADKETIEVQLISITTTLGELKTGNTNILNSLFNHTHN